MKPVPAVRLPAPLLLLALTSTLPARAQLPAERAAALDSIFTSRIAPDGPGCVVGLIRGDSIVHWRGYGLADVEGRVPFTPQSVFNTGSIYKQFVAAGLLLLERQGRLSLEDEARKYLPELPDYAARVTLRQLVDHTHGLREYMSLGALMPAVPVRSEEVLALVARQRAPAFAPGTRFQYGSTGPMLGMLVIDRVTGEPASDFLARELFQPAGMRTTALGETAVPVPLRIPNYSRESEAGLVGRGRSWGAGTLVRRAPSRSARWTLEDLARWNARLDTTDPEWRAVVRPIATPGRLADGTPLDYGLGLRLTPYRGLRREWAPGATVGSRAMIMRFVDVGLTVGLGCNQDMDPISMAEAVADVVLADEIARAERRAPSRAVTLTGAQRRALVGTYVAPVGRVLRVTERGRKLRIAAGDGAEHDPVPTSATRFTIPGRPELPTDAVTEVVFDPARGGQPRALTLETVWYPVRYEAVAPVDPASVVASDYVGTYASDELASDMRVEMRDGGLLLAGPRETHRMEAVARDLFQAGPLQTVRFTRRGGRVAVALVSRGATPDVAFARKGE